MADRGGRGGRGGGRGGDRGGRGGGYGGGGGDRGGRGGGYSGAGGGGGDRGGRGGGFRGDRGGHGGGFGGDRGGRGGGFRGGGGRGGGGRPRSPGPNMVYSLPGPQPVAPVDRNVTELENKILTRQTGTSITDLSKQLGTLKLGSSGGGAQAKSTDLLPLRPNFGTAGQPVVLWANYYSVTVNKNILYKYTAQFAQKQKDSTFKVVEPKGRKLAVIFKKFIADINKNHPKFVIATEFKSAVVTAEKLPVTEFDVLLDNEDLTQADGTQRQPDAFKLKFHGPIEIHVRAMFDWLKEMKPSDQDLFYPRFPEVMDVINIVIGFPARAELTNSAVGTGRVFPFGSGSDQQNLGVDARPLVAARGLFHSTRPGTGRLLLNTNVTHGVFKRSGRVSDIFNEYQIAPMTKPQAAGNRTFTNMAKIFAKSRVTVEMRIPVKGKKTKIVIRNKAMYGVARASEIKQMCHGQHAPRIDQGMEYPGPKHVSFFLQDDREAGGGHWTTVHDYYLTRYEMTLSNYPLLNLGRPDKPTFYPAEIVTITPGQTVKAKLTGNETTAMLSFACHSPHFNANHIAKEGRQLLCLDSSPVLKNFGIETGKDLLTVQGRVLVAPQIRYLGQKNAPPKTVRANQGSWNMIECKVVKPGRPIQRWGYLNIHPQTHGPSVVGKEDVKAFGAFMQQTGININNDPVSFFNPTGADGALSISDWYQKSDAIFKHAKNSKVDFLLFILKEKDSSGLYGHIKQKGDCQYGIHTSIVIGNKFRPTSFQGGIDMGKRVGYFANVCLKWNLKMGGTNHALGAELGLIKEGKTMIVGYDVTHPTNMPAGSVSDAPSIAGLVASVDKDLGQWPGTAWEQNSKQEMVGSRLVEMFISRLKLWASKNRSFPENIIIFRDGVSEGQFMQVLDVELKSIREACAKTCGNKQPKISIIVSVKRHQARFYPASTDEKTKTRSGNVLPGTVVDRGVTQARYWDFFLTAHNALQGTARPARYTVLLDEVFRAKYKNEAANELEKVTHQLCYLFGRATKAVSICPPAYYADILCERARAHRPDIFEESPRQSSPASGAANPAAQTTEVHPDLKDTMFYI